MELARHAWRKSIVIYKGSLQNSLRNSSSGGPTKERVAFACARESDDAQMNDTSVRGERIVDSSKQDDRIFNALGATDELSSYIGLAREFACDSKVEHPYVDKLKRVQMILFDLNHAISRANGTINSFENKHTKDLEEWTLEYANQLPPPEDYIIPGGKCVKNTFLPSSIRYFINRPRYKVYIPYLRRRKGLSRSTGTSQREGVDKVMQREIKWQLITSRWIIIGHFPPASQGGGKACASLHVARTICRRAERSVSPLVRDGALDEEAQIYLNRLSEFLLTVSRMAAKCDQRTENIYIPRAELSRNDEK